MRIHASGHSFGFRTKELSSPNIGPKWVDSVTYLAFIVAAIVVFSSPEETELTVIISWLLFGLINTQRHKDPLSC